jgi:hypothetical protein
VNFIVYKTRKYIQMMCKPLPGLRACGSGNSALGHVETDNGRWEREIILFHLSWRIVRAKLIIPKTDFLFLYAIEFHMELDFNSL